MSKAKACKLFSVLCSFDLGKPSKVYKTTFYDVYDEHGVNRGVATVTREDQPTKEAAHPSRKARRT